MRRTLRTLIAAALMTAVLAPPTAGHAADASAALTWGACPPVPPGVERDPRQQCATLRVPLDYRRPHGRTIDIAISRIRTATPSLRRGILTFNPGGPGGPGLDMPSLFAAVLPAQVQERFDLVGFDPRGIGHSTPVTCGLSPTTPPDLIIPFPAPDGSIARNVAFARRTAADCARLSGDLLPYITTANTARDMDRMRAALGERKLSYFGLSYGSYLGAVYASLFPQRGDRILLDSGVDPRLVWYDQWRTFSIGFVLRFPDFTRWAAARHTTYGLGATPAAVASTYDRLAAALDRDPIVLPDGLVLNGNVFRLLTFDGLYSDFRFPGLAALWRDLAQATAGAIGATGGAAIPAVRRTAIREELAGPPAAAQVPQDNLRASQYPIVCGDAAWPRDLRVYARNVAVDRRIFPRTAGFPANLWPCPFWRFRPIEPPVEVTPRGPRNVLVLQNLRDPATPWITGFGLRQALGRRAAMVSVDQGGHGVYQFTDAPCAADIATRFLVTGALPAHDRLCPGQSPLSATGTNRLIMKWPAGTV